jgi:hypothetical protein
MIRIFDALWVHPLELVDDMRRSRQFTSAATARQQFSDRGGEVANRHRDWQRTLTAVPDR